MTANNIYTWWATNLGNDAAILTVLCGVMALVWFFYEGVRRGFVKPKNESWERDKVSRFLKIIIILGIILGIICIVTAIVAMVGNIAPSYAYRDNPAYLAEGELTNGFDWLTSITLLVMGLAMFIKPIEDVPIATIVGLACGAVCALLLGALLPPALVSLYPNLKWVLVVVFVIVTTAIGLMLKVWVDGVEFISKIVSWPPIAILLSAFCLVQGFAVWIAGVTLIPF